MLWCRWICYDFLCSGHWSRCLGHPIISPPISYKCNIPIESQIVWVIQSSNNVPAHLLLQVQNSNQIHHFHRHEQNAECTSSSVSCLKTILFRTCYSVTTTADNHVAFGTNCHTSSFASPVAVAVVEETVVMNNKERKRRWRFSKCVLGRGIQNSIFGPLRSKY